jgi:hypothetical protein
MRSVVHTTVLLFCLVSTAMISGCGGGSSAPQHHRDSVRFGITAGAGKCELLD